MMCRMRVKSAAREMREDHTDTQEDTTDPPLPPWGRENVKGGVGMGVMSIRGTWEWEKDVFENSDGKFHLPN